MLDLCKRKNNVGFDPIRELHIGINNRIKEKIYTCTFIWFPFLNLIHWIRILKKHLLEY